MGVFLNRAFNDGTVVAIWRITEGEGKSLSEQRLAVDALINNVFEGKYRLCHGEDGVPFLEVVNELDSTGKVGPSDSYSAANRDPEKGEPSVPFVSVSHTKGWAAVMTNTKKHVGIDIELSGRNFSAVEKKSLCPAELARLDLWAKTLKRSLTSDSEKKPSESGGATKETVSAPNPRNTVLGLLWCAKEAVYKRLTVPATDFENQIEIEAIEPASNGTTNSTAQMWPDDPTAENPTANGKITAIFKYEDSKTIKICLEYSIVSGLLVVYTR